MWNNPLILGLVGATAVAAAIGVNVYLWEDEVDAPPAPTEQAAKPAAAPPEPAAPAQVKEKTDKPTFDVVRVTPEGDAVIAGRAKPKSTVAIIDSGQFVGQLNADDRGEWVFVPDKPLQPGSRQLTLEQREDGQKPVASDDVVVVVVPEKDKDIAGRPAKKPTQALALKFPRAGDGPSTVLQKPTPESAVKTLSVDTVDYDDAGRLHISGRGWPKRTVQLYLDNKIISRIAIDANGGWRLKPDSPVAAGLYKLRADEVNAAGKVTARIEIPFARAEPLDSMPPEPFVIVQPGNSLWRLARRAYGSGFRYTTIYAANEDQIKDPDLDLPGPGLRGPANQLALSKSAVAARRSKVTSAPVRSSRRKMR